MYSWVLAGPFEYSIVFLKFLRAICEANLAKGKGLNAPLRLLKHFHSFLIIILAWIKTWVFINPGLFLFIAIFKANPAKRERV